MSAAVLNVPSTPWIISRRDDLIWFIGGSLLGYAVLILSATGFLSPIVLVAWAVMIDGPHVYSTFTRALFDKGERASIGRLWMILFPLCALCCLAALTVGNWPLSFLIFTWGHFHISKQHMGFVMMYKRKAGERQGMALDKHYSIVSLLLPPAYFLTALFGLHVPLIAFLIPAIVLTAFYVQRQARSGSLSFPKLTLLAAFTSLSWAAHIYAAADPTSPDRILAAIVATNVGHSIQYLKLMWFHNNNRYAEQGGLLGTTSRRWLYFFAAAFLLALPANTAQRYNAIAASFMLGFSLFHYILDGRIWRVRGDKALASALRL